VNQTGIATGHGATPINAGRKGLEMRHLKKAWAHWGREFVVLIAAEHGFPIAMVVLGHWFGYWIVSR